MIIIEISNKMNMFLVLIRKVKRNTEIVLLDHGLYQELTEKDRIALSYMWKAIVINDHTEMQKHAKSLGCQSKSKSKKLNMETLKSKTG